MSSQILCCASEGSINIQNPTKLGKKRIEGIKAEKIYRDYDGINGELTEFEWNIFAGFDALQLCDKVKDLLSRLGEKPEYFTGRIVFMSMFNDISCGTRDNEQESLAKRSTRIFVCKKNLVKDNGHSLVLIPKRRGIL